VLFPPPVFFPADPADEDEGADEDAEDEDGAAGPEPVAPGFLAPGFLPFLTGLLGFCVLQAYKTEVQKMKGTANATKQKFTFQPKHSLPLPITMKQVLKK
jgi:hypothetical protein